MPENSLKEDVIYNGKKFFTHNGALNLFNKRIKEITDIKGLVNLKDLEKLFLGGNSIKEIKGLDNLNNLKVLDLEANLLTEIRGLDKLKNLED